MPTSMTSLEDLDVRGTDINDKGLRSVYSLPLLNTLDLVGCRGIARVLDAPLSNAVVVASVCVCVCVSGLSMAVFGHSRIIY